MTVIAYDGVTLAADKKASCQGVSISCTKLRRVEGGVLLAACGDAANGSSMFAWFLAGMPADEFPNKGRERRDMTWLIAVYPNGKVLEWNDTPVPITHDADQPLAWGSGMEAALAALHMGATARRAVEVANMIVDSCGMGVDSFERKG